jgi:hypothetical protein
MGPRGAGEAGANGGGSGCALVQYMSRGVFGGQGNCGKGAMWAPVPVRPSPTVRIAVAAAQRAEERMTLSIPRTGCGRAPTVAGLPAGAAATVGAAGLVSLIVVVVARTIRLMQT